MDEDELAAAAAAFVECPLDLEHVPTVLDGKLGALKRVWISPDRRELHGEAEMPGWLDRLLAEGERKVSATWGRANKTLEKLALVRSPRLKDAALFASFSAAHPDEAEALFATPRKHHAHMTHAWQAIHDQAAMVPGVCPANPVTPSMPVMMGDMTKQYKHLQSAHDHSVMHGAACSGRATMSETETRSTDMPKIDAEAIESPEVTDDEVTEFVHDHPDVLALKAELAAIRAERDAAAAKFAEESEKARVKSVDDAAKSFANDEIKAGRSTSAEFTDLVLSYTDAAHLDHKSGEVVTFADASGAKATGSRVDALKAREAKRPSHSLFSPALGDKELVHDGETILFNSKANDDESSVRAKADAVLATTNEGRNILAKRKKAAK